MPFSRAAMSFSSERTSYMMTLSTNASGSSLSFCCFSFSARMTSSRRFFSTVPSSPIKQQNCFVLAQPSAVAPFRIRSGEQTAMWVSPQMPQGTYTLYFSPSNSVCRTLSPQSQMISASAASRAKMERVPMTGLPHLGQR